MSEDYKEYIFELGDNPKRTYKGERMRPLEGCALGMEVWKIVISVLGNIDLTNLTQGSQEERLSQIMFKGFENIDASLLMGFLKRITSSTLIIAKAEGDTKTYTLDNEQKINEWFSKYPEDLLKFAVQIIWETVYLFLPKEVKEWFQKQGIDIQKTK